MSLFISILVGLIAIFLWTFTEYAMHRFNGHDQKGKTAFSKDHLAHHASLTYFTPKRDKVKRAVLVSAALFPISILLLGMTYGLTFACAYLSAYFYYDFLHWYSHYYPPTTKYGKRVRKHHFAHHFTNPKHNFGVTTVFWDKVFGTYFPVTIVRVPEKRAMCWLYDSQSNQPSQKFTADYKIIPKRKTKPKEKLSA